MKKNIFLKKCAWTLAEVSIVFLIIGVVSASFCGIYKVQKNLVQKDMSYAAFNSLRTLSARTIAEGNELIVSGNSGETTPQESEEDGTSYNPAVLKLIYGDIARYKSNLLLTYLFCKLKYDNNACETAKSSAALFYSKLSISIPAYINDKNKCFAYGCNSDSKYYKSKAFTEGATNIPEITVLDCSSYGITAASIIEDSDENNTEIGHLATDIHSPLSITRMANMCFGSYGMWDPSFELQKFLHTIHDEVPVETPFWKYTAPFEIQAEDDFGDYIDYLSGYTNKNDPSDDEEPTPDSKIIEKALPETGAKLCEKASNTYNIIGATHCTDGSIVDDSSDFSTATPNFVTTNSIAFYNFSSNPTAGTAGDYSTQLYTVYADINGVKKGKSKLNEDVLKFTLRRDGVVLPAADSIIANSKDYLSAAVKYDTFADKKRITNWIGTGLVFREAACKNGLTSGAYCGAVTGYPKSYTKAPACTTNACELLINNPIISRLNFK